MALFARSEMRTRSRVMMLSGWIRYMSYVRMEAGDRLIARRRVKSGRSSSACDEFCV